MTVFSRRSIFASALLAGLLFLLAVRRWRPAAAVAAGTAALALAGFLAGAIGTGCLMAVFLANSGGSWDNAKKIVEDGNYGGKGSAAHEATVIGDTVGDPFKDTAGPAINPLIKVMNLVAVLIAPAIVLLSVGEGANAPVRYGIAGVSLVIVVTAVAISKRRDLAIGGGDDDGEPVSELDASAPDSGAVTAPGEAVDESLTHGDHLEANAPR